MLCLTWTALMAHVMRDSGDFNPENPGDPGEPDTTKTYTLTAEVTPSAAGYTSPTSTTVTEGTSVTVRAYNYSNYVFQYWTHADTIVSTSTSIKYVMPAEDVTLTAVFEYNPDDPDDPDEAEIQPVYTLTTTVTPSTAGSTSPTSSSVTEGTSVSVYVSKNSNYVFQYWTHADTIVSTSTSFKYVMPAEDVTLTAVLEYDPDAPDNPGANYYDSTTGEVIVDDFTAGSLASAIDEVIGGSSYRKTVTMVTVIGSMRSSDFSFVDNLTNCNYIDLTRTYGFTEVPSSSFDATNLVTVKLPSVVESIGNKAFYDCASLTSLSVYAVTPPSVGTNAFYGIPDGLVVYVPAASVSIYSETEVWEDFTILPLEDDVYELQVSLPDDASDGRYKDMTLELVNSETGQRYKYVITDRTVYTFNSLMSNTSYNVYVKNASSAVLGTLSNVQIVEDDVQVAFESLLQPQDVLLSVLAPDGTDLTSQTTITWLDSLGSYLKQGSQLTGQIEGTQLTFRITLQQTLAMSYLQPTDSTITIIDGDNSVTYTLEPFKEVAISGTVTDASTDNAISGATVTVSQTLNSKYTKTMTSKTDTEGVFSITIFNAPSVITVSSSDYVSVSLDSLSLTEDTDIGSISLSEISGVRITTNYTYTESVEEDGTATIKSWYDDYANVSYSLYDVTQNKSIVEFNVQYPQIVLLEDVPDGDCLSITASSKKAAFTDVTVECTISDNAATVTIPIVELGQLSASFTSTDNDEVIGILYNADGQYVKSYTYSNAFLSISDLADDNYSLITMTKSALFNSILNLSDYESAGLIEGTHYIRDDFAVKSGVITTISNDVIPVLDETTFSFTGSDTYFTVNKTSITSGNYLTLKGKIDFADEYADEISNVALVVDLPDECSFVESSVMVGSSLSGYTFDGSRITIPITNLSDYVRFCIIPTLGGDYAPSAYASFSLDGTDVLQPIGNAIFSVSDLSITVPSLTAKTSVALSGTATSSSEVTIYDGDIIIGNTTALANGSWNATCELDSPDNLSTHDIYAKVVTTLGLELQSETAQLQYDANAVMVSKVKMYHNNPEVNTTYEIVYDFITPSSESQYYIYYIWNKVFTFTIEFTNNSPDIVNDVVIYVKTGTDNQISLEAEYDSIQDLWVTSGEFGNMYDGDIPVNVSVGFAFLSETLADTLAYYSVFNNVYEGAEVQWLSTDSTGVYTFSVTPDDESMAYECIVLSKPASFLESLNSVLEGLSYTLADFSESAKEYYVSPGLDSYVTLTTSTDSILMLAVFDCEDSLEYRALWEALSGTLSSEENLAKQKVFYYDPGSSEIRSSTDPLNRWRDNMIQPAIDMANSKLKCADDETNIRLHEAVNRLRQCVGFSIGSFLSFVVMGTRPGDPYVVTDILSFGDGGMEGLSSAAHQALEYIRNAPSCGSGDNNPHDSGNPDTSYGLDPSGYVYEGVSSNRLEGVTATCYYKETLEDMYGDQYEVVDVWDASAYAQENPLFTDENGMYRWDVPEGLWQVKFEKDGYVTTYSEWLPVPPPQLEVNIAMTQNLQPDVQAVNAYEEGIEVLFDKYMQPSTLTTDYIYAIVADAVVAGEITLIDEEVSYEGETDTYASKVRFVPTSPFLYNEEVTLTVSRKVKSYAGVQMENDFSQTFDIQKEVKSLVVDSIINVAYGGEKTITISALPYDAAVGRTMIAKTSSSIIASVSADTLTLDDDGQATITIKGVLPGVTSITFSLDDTDVNCSATINVANASMFTSAPVASRASGTAVYRYSEVQLTCDTEDAVIYYTTDGTCPCDENGTRIIYDSPIVLSEPVTIMAMAVADGMIESDVVTFSYTIRTTTLSISMSEGWNWISHDMESAVSLTELGSGVTDVIGQDSEATGNDGSFTGTLSSMDADQSYKVKACSDTQIILNGYEYNGGTAKSLQEGCNWIGYPIDQTMTVTEAFAYADIEDGDCLVGQDGFTIFDDGQWVGTLEVMNPGEGFLYYSQSAKDITYNLSIVSKAKSLYGKASKTATYWAVDKHTYPNILCLVANVYSDGTLVDEDAYTIGAFSGTECRGVGTYVDGKLMMNIYGDEGETITFVAMDNETETCYNIIESEVFVETVKGSLTSPCSLNIGDDLSGITNVESHLRIYPLVVYDLLYVESYEKIDKLLVFDISGNVVMTATNLHTGESVSLQMLPEGIYIVSAHSAGNVLYRKITKTDRAQ